jgi:hypothetical protein
MRQLIEGVRNAPAVLMALLTADGVSGPVDLTIAAFKAFKKTATPSSTTPCTG